MSDPIMDNLVLDRLREIRSLLGEVKEDTADTRLGVGMLEAGYASVSIAWTGWRPMSRGSSAALISSR